MRIGNFINSVDAMKQLRKIRLKHEKYKIFFLVHRENRQKEQRFPQRIKLVKQRRLAENILAVSGFRVFLYELEKKGHGS